MVGTERNSQLSTKVWNMHVIVQEVITLDRSGVVPRTHSLVWWPDEDRAAEVFLEESLFRGEKLTFPPKQKGVGQQYDAVRNVKMRADCLPWKSLGTWQDLTKTNTLGVKLRTEETEAKWLSEGYLNLVLKGRNLDDCWRKIIRFYLLDNGRLNNI